MQPTTPKHRVLRPYASLVEGLVDTRQFLEDRLHPLLDFVIRLQIALVFLASGLVKASSWPSAIWLGTAVELVCPMLLAAGLLTRFAAVPLFLTAAFLQFTYKELPVHLYWMALLALVFVRGAGPISVDRLLAPHLHSTALPLPLVHAFRRMAAAFRRYALPTLLLFLRAWIAWLAWTTLFPPGPLPLRATGALIAGALALGLAARMAALALFVAVVLFPDAAGLGGSLYLGFLLIDIALGGPGPLAVDEPIRRRIEALFPGLSGRTEWLSAAPRVVVVGAGFGGIAAVKGLRHAYARVTLIDRRNYHLFQPLLYQVATASLSPADIASPIRALVRDQANCTVLMGRVTGIDTVDRAVLVGDCRIAYDHLVVATGARHSYFGKDAWETLAPGLKKIDDATAMRARILAAFERAETTADTAERRRLLTFVVVGGGPTGVELAGAIAELAHHGLQGDFRTIDPEQAEVILVQSAPRVLPGMAEALSEKALQALQRLGVRVLLNARVEEIDAVGVKLAAASRGGERIEARTVLWAAGVMASPAGRWLAAERDQAGRIVVASDLSVPGCADVFAIGDTAACGGPGGRPLPGLAAVAKQQGRHVAMAIRARIEGRNHPGPFRYRDFGTMATIGRKAAVADILGVKLSGAAAWWLWSAVHVAFLVDVRSRVAVLGDWFWSYLTYGRSIRLITGGDGAVD